MFDARRRDPSVERSSTDKESHNGQILRNHPTTATITTATATITTTTTTTTRPITITSVYDSSYISTATGYHLQPPRPEHRKQCDDVIGLTENDVIDKNKMSGEMDESRTTTTTPGYCVTNVRVTETNKV